MPRLLFRGIIMTERLPFKQASKVVNLLIRRSFTISFAESCTGGMACARLVDVPNASKVLNASFITYANEAKISLLGVDPSLLEQEGAVSESVASAMAKGVALANKAQIGVGISGIAGPEGGTDEKPVGTVCFGFFINGTLSAATVRFGDLGRQEVRAAAVDYVFERLTELLQA